MYQLQVIYIISLLMVVDGVLFIISSYFSSYLTTVLTGYTWGLPDSILIGLTLFLIFINNIVMGLLGLYSDKRISSFVVIIKKLFIAVLIDFSILNIALFSIQIENVSRQFIFTFSISVFLLLILFRIFFEYYSDKYINKSFNSRQILLVGNGERLVGLYHALQDQKSWGHVIMGYLTPSEENNAEECDVPHLGSITRLEYLISKQNVDEVFFALPPRSEIELAPYLDLCEKIGVNYRIVPSLYSPQDKHSIKVESIQGIPIITHHTITIDPSGLLRKRIFDILVSTIGLIFLLIMYPFVALAIKIDSSGPVFFKQPRVGQNGRIFKIIKFRTMYIDAEERKSELLNNNEMKGMMFKMENDPRITRVGKFLRKTSLDEFPQFINVIKGEMSIVGTRPPTLDEVDKYKIWHRRRISMKPGITGLWQISGRNKINDFDKVVELDLQYIDKWRFLYDFQILLKTIWIVLQRKGAC